MIDVSKISKDQTTMIFLVLAFSNSDTLMGDMREAAATIRQVAKLLFKDKSEWELLKLIKDCRPLIEEMQSGIDSVFGPVH